MFIYSITATWLRYWNRGIHILLYSNGLLLRPLLVGISVAGMTASCGQTGYSTPEYMAWNTYLLWSYQSTYVILCSRTTVLWTAICTFCNHLYAPVYLCICLLEQISLPSTCVSMCLQMVHRMDNVFIFPAGRLWTNVHNIHTFFHKLHSQHISSSKQD